MNVFEKLLVYGLNDGRNIGCWDLDDLVKKVTKSPKPLTFAEKHAIEFFEEMGKHMKNLYVDTN